MQGLDNIDDNVLDRLVVSGDQTKVLSEGYWPSYNVPFYEEVSNISIALLYNYLSLGLFPFHENSGLHFRQFSVTSGTAFPEFPEKKATMQSIPKFSPNFLPGISVPFDFQLRAWWPQG